MEKLQEEEEVLKPESKTPEDLLAMVYHTDGRVNAIAGRLDVQGTQLDRIESAILNKQPTWTNTAVLGVIAGVAGVLFGISEYVGLQNQPIKDVLAANVHWKDDKDAFQRQSHYEFGQYNAWISHHKEESVHMDALFHNLEDRVRQNEKDLSAAKVSRTAIGDYAKEVNAALMAHRELDFHKGKITREGN